MSQGGARAVMTRKATIGEVVDADGSGRRQRLEHLLGDIYEEYDVRRRTSLAYNARHLSLETESWTTGNSSSATSFSEWGPCGPSRYTRPALKAMDADELRRVLSRLRSEAHDASLNLVKQLKRRDHQLSRAQAKCNLITAVLQAHSQKRSVDAKLQFSLDPPTTETGYQQWLNAMKAVARLPDGIPNHFRKNLWVTLACHHIEVSGVDWSDVCRVAFNDRINPDDDALGLQIIKDLHRTGWSGLHGDRERVLLKRVLLAYARYNKAIGYCQGFNVIAALVLEVVDYKEDVAFKVMVFLIEHVLPSGYFDQTLRALSVDMAVLRDLLHQRLPKMAAHLDALQAKSESEYEPPLTNVFSMQWFLTLFATCLPKSAVFRVWDSIMLDGSEVLLRTSLAIWAKISRRVLKTKTADEFYELMGSLCQGLLQMNPTESNDLMQIIYSMAEFPYPGVAELRERYTWNIQPFSSTFKLLRHQVKSILATSGDEDNSVSDTERDSDRFCGTSRSTKSTAPDMGALKKQYKLMKQRQKQAAIILQNAYERRHVRLSSFGGGDSAEGGGPGAQATFNHLYVAQHGSPVMTYATCNGALQMSSKAIQPCALPRRLSSEHSRRRTSSPVLTAAQVEAGARNSRPQRGSIDSTLPNETLLSSGSVTPTCASLDSLHTTTLDDDAILTTLLDHQIHHGSFDHSMLRRSNSLGGGCPLRVSGLGVRDTDRDRSLFSPQPATTEYGHGGGMSGRRRFNSLVDLNLAARLRQAQTPPVPADATRQSSELLLKANLHRIRFDSLNTSGRAGCLSTGHKRDAHAKPPSDVTVKPRNGTVSSSARRERTAVAGGGVTQAHAVVGGQPTTERELRGLNGAGNGGHQQQQRLMNKSKALLNAIVADAEKTAAKPVFNPFPVRHRTSLIEREKQFGLYK